MNKETAEKNIGCYFSVKNRKCQVTKVDSFGGELHYGFHTIDDGNFVVGWIPVELIGGCEW